MSWKQYLQLSVRSLAAFVDEWFYYIVGVGSLLAIYNTFFLKDWDKELFLAIRANDKDKVLKALNSFADVNCKQTKFECTPLIAAAHKNCAEIAEILLKQRGIKIKEVDVNGSSALHFAAISGSLETARVLLSHKADVKAVDNDGNTPLILAANGGYLSMVKLLLANGSETRWKNRRGVNAIHAALNKHGEEGGRLDVLKLLLVSAADVETKTPSGWTPLVKSAFAGYYDLVKYLLHRGASIDVQTAHGFTALIAAAQNGWRDVVQLLLEHGADPSLRTADGSTALVAACFGGYQEIVAQLSAHRQCVNLTYKNGSTALMTTCLKGFIGAARVLLAHGAEVNTQNDEGWTALTIATEKGFYKIAQLLLENGAGVDPCTGKGFTPLMLSLSCFHDELTELLLQHKAAVNHFRLEDGIQQQQQQQQQERESRLLSLAKQPDGTDMPFIFGYIPPLHLAIAAADNDRVVQQLLDSGADPRFNMNSIRRFAQDPFDLRLDMNSSSNGSGIDGGGNSSGSIGGTSSQQQQQQQAKEQQQHPFLRDGKALTREQQRRLVEEAEELRLQADEEFERRESELSQTSAIYTLLPTALIFAAYLNRLEVIRMLLSTKSYSLNVNDKNANGETAIDVALLVGNVDAALLLLRSGAQFSPLRDYAGPFLRFLTRMLTTGRPRDLCRFLWLLFWLRFFLWRTESKAMKQKAD